MLLLIKQLLFKTLYFVLQVTHFFQWSLANKFLNNICHSNYNKKGAGSITAPALCFVIVVLEPHRWQELSKTGVCPALKKLGIPHRHLYAMRHTFGTIAVEQNMDILSVAYLMGHKKPRTVLDHYTNLRYTPKTLPKINPASRRSWRCWQRYLAW